MYMYMYMYLGACIHVVCRLKAFFCHSAVCSCAHMHVARRPADCVCVCLSIIAMLMFMTDKGLGFIIVFSPHSQSLYLILYTYHIILYYA